MLAERVRQTLSFGGAAPHELTRVDVGAETPAGELGLDPARVDKVWTKIEHLYRSGVHPAITLVVRRSGRVVLKRSIGRLAADGAGAQVLATPDTPVCLFSASKAITALLVHKLIEDGKLGLDQRVADHIPEFAAHGKHRVTLRQLMAHRAGIPVVPMKNPDPSLLLDWDEIIRLLCAAKPMSQNAERQAYHAVTGGFILGELVRRVGKIELRDALREWIAKPLQLRYLDYGLTPELRAHAARDHFSGPLLWPVTTYVKRMMGVSFERVVSIANDEAWFSSVVPAGNIYASADDLSRVFQMMLNEGVLDGARVFKPETLEEAVRPSGPIRVDGMLLVPLRFSAGFMLGESPFGLFGPKCRHAYGHLGFVNVLGWADPERELSVALLNTGKSMNPIGVTRLASVLGAIAKAFPVMRR
jgi:CubicO group peptidase (beta-lactamase class C family)